MPLQRAVIESPFAAPTEDGRQRNLRYARACLLDSLQRGEAPFASHLLYPQVLDDNTPELREQGIAAGFAWAETANLWVFYTDLGVSPGMQGAVETAVDKGRQPIFRRLWPRLVWQLPVYPTDSDKEHLAEFRRRVLSDAEVDRLLVDTTSTLLQEK